MSVGMRGWRSEKRNLLMSFTCKARFECGLVWTGMSCKILPGFQNLGIQKECKDLISFYIDYMFEWWCFYALGEINYIITIKFIYFFIHFDCGYQNT